MTKKTIKELMQSMGVTRRTMSRYVSKAKKEGLQYFSYELIGGVKTLVIEPEGVQLIENEVKGKQRGSSQNSDQNHEPNETLLIREFYERLLKEKDERIKELLNDKERLNKYNTNLTGYFANIAQNDTQRLKNGETEQLKEEVLQVLTTEEQRKNKETTEEQQNEKRTKEEQRKNKGTKEEQNKNSGFLQKIKGIFSR